MTTGDTASPEETLETEYYAHTRPEGDPREWPLLSDHLLGVAQRAAATAEAFGAQDLAYMAGLLHDIGKYHPDFAAYLQKCASDPQSARRGEVKHSPAAAFFCTDDLEFIWPAVAGHHAGIYPLRDPDLAELRSRHTGLFAGLPADAERFLAANRRPARFPDRFKDSMRLAEPLLRFLFSCLVDADAIESAIDAGTYMDMRYPSLEGCRLHFLGAYAAVFGEPVSELDKVRRRLFDDCRSAADAPTGFFRLTAPTGCAKTLASLAFALDHTRANPTIGRVIYAAPYTSIIDQTAAEYRRFLPNGAVLEHHCAVEPPDTETQEPQGKRMREAVERWAAPVIVTTTVQLFESLFSNRRSRCRKLHNIANSVILLDEVQALPPQLLTPTCDMLAALVEGFGCTVCLCTATQPALDASSPIPVTLPKTREMAKDVPTLFSRMKRVDYEIETETCDVALLVERIRMHPTVLVVTNTKRLAREVWKALGDDDALHLSTLLCPAHRKRVLDRVKARLPGPCRLISTQVVEAGVNLDFPVVFREFGPLDRIVQAAGRCNRNGEPGVPPFGRAIVFTMKDAKAPPGPYSLAIGSARRQLAHGGDLHDPVVYERFFRAFYGSLADTGQRVQDRRAHFDYPEVARLYRMIDTDTEPVLIYDEAQKVTSARNATARVGAQDYITPLDWQALQSFSVPLRKDELARLSAKDLLAPEWVPGLHLWRGYYHPNLGLGETVQFAIEDLMVHGGS